MKFIKFMVALSASCSSFVVWAATARALTPFSEKQALSSNQVTGKDYIYHIQDFQDGAVKVQFRYVHGKLTYIQFVNTSDKALKLRVLDNNYILGEGDSLVINPPKVRYLKVGQEPYFSGQDTTIANQILPQRFQKDSLYTLPKNADAETVQ